ncbi:leucine-rich repeat domain-containing protein [Tenacibaculum agarivorans]|uniref:leucine-rich repeat domain-containing protein n=1 Tax=Tenacibaculum agarivorans TaxID=1908389 RepID=UPI000A9A1D00|nr:hypothetical protein [Tenacibaculum agarivorans]
MKKFYILILQCILGMAISHAQYTSIPDQAFETALENLGYDDISGDGQVPTALIEHITELNIENTGIANLTGVQDFAALTNLNCSRNSIQRLELQGNPLLEVLNFNRNVIDSLNINNNAALRVLSGERNKLKHLIVSNNPALEVIDVELNQLTDINLSNNEMLKSLVVKKNFGFNALDLSNNPALEILLCNATAIPAIDLSNKLELTNVQAFECNNLETLNLANNSKLIELRIHDTAVTTVDISDCVVLKDLNVQNANIRSLNASANPLLETVNIADNEMLSFNIQNNNNNIITSFNATGNPNLQCIVVDDVDYSTTSWTAIDAASSFTLNYCRYTAIPDPAFETALENLGYDDISGDGQVPTAIVENIINLNVQDQFPRIEYLTGIEDFRELKVLDVIANNISNLNLSANSNLVSLYCNSNGMETLNIIGLTQLEELICDNNSALTGLDFTTNGNLKKIDCSDTRVTSLDLSQLPLLTDLDCHMNPFLTSLNVKNGNNENVTNFKTSGTNNLNCIVVDDVAYSTANWTNIDAGTSFSDTYCRYTEIPDANFEARLEALGFDDISNDGQVPTALIENITSLDVQSQSISSLSGIEDFTALESLRCTNNLLTELNVSALEELVFLWCNQNDLDSLNLSDNTKIRFINASQNVIESFNGNGLDQVHTLELWSNQLTEVNLVGMDALRVLSLANNILDDLEVSDNTLLEEFGIKNNNISFLDLSNNSALKTVDVRDNDLNDLNIKNENNANITSFDARGNSKLNCILVYDVAYSTASWTSIDPQTSFNEVSCTTDFSLALKVFLQGASLNPNVGEETLMRDDLRVEGLIPTTSPYTDGLTCDASVFSVTGDNAIIDWVWIELRDATDNTVVSYSKSALLQRDGDVVDVDGVSVLNFSVAEDTYYITIKHRNHLAIRSANVITFSTVENNSIDFTNNTSLIKGGSNAVVDLGNSKYALFAGDEDANGQIQNTDINSVITIIGGSGYSDADMDMNGQVQNTDINNLMNPNVGKGEQL